MTSKSPTTERLNLTFRAESAPPKNAFPRGWWIGILVGIAIGIATWFVGQRLLKTRLSQQLAESSLEGEAYWALEGLMQLEGESSPEIVAGLENADPNIARAAYSQIDRQITSWQASEEEDAIQRLGQLAQRLSQLSPTTSPESQLLASSLAARIYAFCVKKNDPALASLMKTCQIVVQRAGRSPEDEPVTLPTIEEQAERLAAIDVNYQPPPPLPPTEDSELPRQSPPPLPETTETNGQFTAETPAPIEMHTAELGPATSPPMATLQLVPQATRPRTRSTMEETSYSLSDTIEPLENSPTVAHRISDAPSTRVSVDPPVSLNGLENKPDKQLVRLLGSVQPRVSQAASLMLRARGWPDEQLELASELATCSEARRIELIHEIAVRTDLNAKTWLLWMAEDGQPAVRRHAVSLLNSMLDEEVQLGLRNLLRRENDETVSQTIRQVLLSGANKSVQR